MIKIILFTALIGLVVSAPSSPGLNPGYLALIKQSISDGNDMYEERELTSKAALTGCAPYPAGTASSVHALTPASVTVVAAMGDSLTAANGAKANTMAGLTLEDRDLSWSIGGADKAITFPNILKSLSPNLCGFSTAQTTLNGYNKTQSQLNVANPGDTSHEMPFQARLLVERMKTFSCVNMQTSWKIVNLFIGGNDLCNFCKNEAKYSADNYTANIKTALDHLKANLPRTLVNLVMTLDVTGIEVLDLKGQCRIAQNQFCDCALDSALRAKILKLTQDMQTKTEQLIESGTYNNDNLFTVVLHKFMKHMTPPLDMTSNGNSYVYFAPDCFHFSTLGHQAAALELWNSMFTPDATKDTAWDPRLENQPVICPNIVHPYIYTHVNSKNVNTESKRLPQILRHNN